MKNVLDFDSSEPIEELTVENSNQLKYTYDNIGMVAEEFKKDLPILEQYVGILTVEDASYVSKLKPFFIDGVQKIVSATQELKDKFLLKDDVFKDKIKDLEKYGRSNKDIKNLKFSKYEDMQVPVMLGTNVDYLKASQKLIKFSSYIPNLNKAINGFISNLEQMMNEKSDDRLVLRKHDDRYFNIVEAKSETSDLIRELVNSKSKNDMMKITYLLPNFHSVDTIRDNFTNICKELHKADISKLDDNVNTLVKTIETWQRVLKKQDDTRHSAYMVSDIKDNTVHIAELTTNIGMLITITFQYITFYNRMIAELAEKK